MYKDNQKILLVEDDLVLGETMTELIKYNGYKVTWKKNGLEAFETLRDFIPDIIICDLMMPLMDGETFFKKVRNHKRYDNIPFIMITANIDTNVKFKQLENGVNDIINKPFALKELVLKIKNLLFFNANILKKAKESHLSQSAHIKSKDFFSVLDDFLFRNIQKKMSITSIADQLFVSKSTLDKKIRKHKNQNISQYIKEFKIEYAIQLMEKGENNIEHLASKSGFSSVSYFSSSFKSVKGESPKQYFKNYLK